MRNLLTMQRTAPGIIAGISTPTLKTGRRKLMRYELLKTTGGVICELLLGTTSKTLEFLRKTALQ